jgi:acylphosphatase
VTDGSRGRFEATVSGRVQGVGFRWFVLDRATDLAVVCVAEGDRASLAALETALRSGPSGSRVDALRVVWTAPTGMAGGFHIRSLGHGGD